MYLSGQNVKILHGVTIGDNSVISSGVVVSRELPADVYVIELIMVSSYL
mgnify:CR=1 FL=1